MAVQVLLVVQAHPAMLVGIMGMAGIAAATQATQAAASPPLQTVMQVDTPRRISGRRVLIAPMTKLTIPIKHWTASTPLSPLSSSVSVSVLPVLSHSCTLFLLLLGFAWAIWGVSWISSRPATRVKIRSLCPNILIVWSSFFGLESYWWFFILAVSYDPLLAILRRKKKSEQLFIREMLSPTHSLDQNTFTFGCVAQGTWVVERIHFGELASPNNWILFFSDLLFCLTPPLYSAPNAHYS